MTRFHFQPHCPCKHCDPPLRWKWMLGMAALFVGLTLNCYATTGPTPSCAQDPSQPGCLAPPSDDVPPWAQSEKSDGGRR